MIAKAYITVLAFGYPMATLALNNGSEASAVLKQDNLLFVAQSLFYFVNKNGSEITF
jgi:hypothetical protein